MFRFFVLVVLLTLPAAWTVGTDRRCQADQPIDFGRDVRPILSDKCFYCHGPDAGARQADLRLDRRDDAISAGAIVAGEPAESEIVARIMSHDPDYVMPPPQTGKTVSAAERQILRRWIEQGGTYAQHWAFTPPKHPQPPPVTSSWERNPIDSFVLRELKQRGLSPSPTADRVTLARRIYLDLIGLPPSPAQIDEFASSDNPAANADLVEGLLSSQHFGEKWARWWLDAARYADSDGYEKDKPRSVWFYRDWVVQAMNQDLPFDEFIVHQIAGDLLPNASQSERVATGFLRNSMVNEEGGADPEQFRVEGMFDRMDAIGKSILGVTTQCAQCHTHKFDPLSQREYYQMFAALNDFHEATISVFTPAQAELRNSIERRVAELEQQLQAANPDWQSRMAEWEQSWWQENRVPWHAVTPTDIPYEGQKFKILEDGSIVSESYAPTKTTNSFSLAVESPHITAFRLDALQHPQLPRGGPGRSIYGTGALTEFEVAIAPADEPDKQRDIPLKRAVSDANPSHSRLPAVFRDKNPDQDERVTGPIEYAIDGDSKTAWSTDVGPAFRNQDRHAIFWPQTPIREDGKFILTFTLKQNHGGWNSDDNQNYLLGRYRFSVTDQPVADTTTPSSVETILTTPRSSRSSEQQSQLFSYWRSIQPEFSHINQEIDALWSQFPETDTQLVVERVERPRSTYVFTRGDFLKKAERVQPGVPEFLGPLPDSSDPPRLRFAKWLVRPEAPTTARVVVNRIWQAYFGRGLVESPEDFGYQSLPPSHPDLLDWLAVELVDNNWSLKHIHRLIVDSATYRQQSLLTEELRESDPANIWLARGPRFRVDAEVVRDIALTASGLLNPAVGGPSVYPPAPEFLFEPPASYGPKVWPVSDAADRYRRSLYVHSYRSVPYPALQVFDAPKGDAACIRRERSNTPLQALVLLNEPQFVECARALAMRIVREAGPSDADRIQLGHRLVVGRMPTDTEFDILQELLNQQRHRVAQGELQSQELLNASPALVQQLTGQPATDLVPWVIVARALLNLDETITKQ